MSMSMQSSDVFLMRAETSAIPFLFFIFNTSHKMASTTIPMTTELQP